MKMPSQFMITTREYIQIQTKLNLYIAQYGCKQVEAYLDAIPIRMKKQYGRNVGAYIVSKVCQEYELSQFELFEAITRKERTEARKVLCALVDKHLDMSHSEIAAQFQKSRHFALRAIKEVNAILEDNHPLDKELISRYKRIDSLVSAYIGFKPKKKEE